MMINARVGPLAWRGGGIWVTASGPNSASWMEELVAYLSQWRTPTTVHYEAGEYMWGQSCEVGWRFESMAEAAPVFGELLAALALKCVHSDTEVGGVTFHASRREG